LEFVISLFWGGVNGLLEYLSAHVITCLVPALFIAGAISAFISQSAVLKFFGPKANKAVSYSVASVSGAILAVCSCTVLPLFAGIYKKGAGIGPAVVFLFSGPAINVLAVVYSARLLGWEIGFARAAAAIVFAIVIGLIMALMYHRDKSKGDAAAFDLLENDSEKPLWQQIIFIADLVAVLIFAASQNWLALGIFLIFMLVILRRWFSRTEIIQWLKETLHFTRLIIPWLLVGVFAAGILKVLIPESIVSAYVGGSGIQASFIASFLGMLMYFATLTEVPVIKAFIDLGMGNGPALALLLAGPALSLPSMLVIRKVMGTKRMLTYAALVVIMSTMTGYLFGIIA
jgi:uncharacterized protein